MIQKPKGTNDIFGSDGYEVLYLENLLKTLMEKYNYEYMRTPLFESSELFHRGVGETTDIVSKETYDFKDRSDRNLTLRPEGTAGIVRSFIENKMYARSAMPVKSWYYGPMYRYERPQAGRYREFYQFGLEVFGSNDPLVDVEVISVIVNLFKLLGIKNIKVKLNSLGDKESRDNYRQALIDYFKPHLNKLCEDCNARFSKNPLRILDCKVDHDLDIMKNTPKMVDYLTEESKKHFNQVLEYLETLEIDYEIDHNLVRGLDYYTDTIFEINADVKELGNQNVLCGGGRYNNLISNLGGSDMPAVGVAIGVDRLLQVLKLLKIDLFKEPSLDVYLIPIDTKTYSLKLLEMIRMNGFKADIDYMDRNMKANFKQADRLNSKYIIIIGDEEVKNKTLTINDNKTKEEYKVKEEELINFLDEKIGDSDD